MLFEAGHLVFGSGPLGEILLQKMSDIVCAWPSITCLDLLQIVQSLWLPLLGLGAH